MAGNVDLNAGAGGDTIAADNARVSHLSATFTVSAGGTSAQTWKLRMGCISGVTGYVNGDSAARKFGGVAKTYLRITETLP
jgi:hypothetical protein|tara:strand:+ start:439 stop:681 length:243 start_codon:yes stop_codon:yes gene_type:complete